jgi:hypothetical protein
MNVETFPNNYESRKGRSVVFFNFSSFVLNPLVGKQITGIISNSLKVLFQKPTSAIDNKKKIIFFGHVELLTRISKFTPVSFYRKVLSKVILYKMIIRPTQIYACTTWNSPPTQTLKNYG